MRDTPSSATATTARRTSTAANAAMSRKPYSAKAPRLSKSSPPEWQLEDQENNTDEAWIQLGLQGQLAVRQRIAAAKQKRKQAREAKKRKKKVLAEAMWWGEEGEKSSAWTRPRSTLQRPAVAVEAGE